MIRRLFATLSALSLLLCAVTVASWVGSYYVRWERVELTRCDVEDVLDREGPPSLAAETYRGVLFEGGRIILYRTSGNVSLGPRPRWEFNERVVGRNLSEPRHWWWAAGSPSIFGTPHAYREVGVRTVLVVVAFAMLPACWAIVALGRRRRLRPGLCASCGYDLRASPDGCPECGMVPAVMGGWRPRHRRARDDRGGVLVAVTRRAPSRP
jgi:hypothetical protein